MIICIATYRDTKLIHIYESHVIIYNYFSTDRRAMTNEIGHFAYTQKSHNRKSPSHRESFLSDGFDPWKSDQLLFLIQSRCNEFHTDTRQTSADSDGRQWVLIAPREFDLLRFACVAMTPKEFARTCSSITSRSLVTFRTTTQASEYKYRKAVFSRGLADLTGGGTLNGWIITGFSVFNIEVYVRPLEPRSLQSRRHRQSECAWHNGMMARCNRSSKSRIIKSPGKVYRRGLAGDSRYRARRVVLITRELIYIRVAFIV